MSDSPTPPGTSPPPRAFLSRHRSAARLLGVALAWLFLISALHAWRNGERHEGRIVRMGHMPVLANLACPLLDEASRGAKTRFLATKYASFAEMADAFRTGNIDVAFIIGPLPLVLRSQGVPATVVYVGNRHESTLVARKELGIPRGGVAQLAGRSVAVPLRFSGHYLALRRLLARAGLSPESVKVVEMQPPDMAAALQAGSLDAYFVGEPFAAKSLKAGLATVVAYAEDDWPGFFSNVMIVREGLIRTDPDLVRTLVHGAVRASAWAERNPTAAAALAARYWGQDPALLLWALGTPPGRVQFRLGVPGRSDLEGLFGEMVTAGLLDGRHEGIVGASFDGRFALSASLAGLGPGVGSILPPGGGGR